MATNTLFIVSPDPVNFGKWTVLDTRTNTKYAGGFLTYMEALNAANAAYTAVSGPPSTMVTTPISLPVGGPVPRRHTKPGLRRLALFDSAANTGGGSSAYITNMELENYRPFTGETHAVFTVPAAGTFRFSQTAVNSTPIDMTNGQIHINFIPSVGNTAATPTGMFIELYSAGTPAAPGTKFISADIRTEVAARHATAGKHGCFSISVSEINTLNGGAVLTDKTAVLFVMLRLTYAAASVGGQVALGSIDYVPNQSTKAKVIFTFDDGYRASNLIAKKILDRYGFPGVLYPDPVSVSFGTTSPESAVQRMTVQDIDDFVQAGWQVASQRYGIEGSNASMTDDIWLQYQAQNLSLRRQMGWPGGEDGSLYGGTANPFSNGVTPTLIAKARAARRLYRTIRSYYFGPLSITETYPLGDPHAVRSPGFNAFGNHSAANVGTNTMLSLTRAGAAKGVVVYTLHGELDLVYNGNNQALTDANVAAFTAVVAACAANPDLYDVTTMMALAPN